MRAVIQRVTEASVTVNQKVVGQIGPGLVVFLGVQREDNENDVRQIADKTVGLRIFPDSANKMNLSLRDVSGQVLVVSQFTLLGDARQGRRPSFVQAAEPDLGRILYESYVLLLQSLGISVATGQFQAEMKVALVNDGPVTILLDSKKNF